MSLQTEILTPALQDLGVLAAGEVPSAEDAALALDRLNKLLDMFGAERLMITKVVRTVWTIVSGTQDYTVGTGGTVNIVRPAYINQVNYQRTDTNPVVEFHLYPHTDDSWAALAIKTLTAPLPTQFYYNPTFPLGTLSFWPIPTSGVLQGVIYAPTAQAQFTAVTDLFSAPPGYAEMLTTLLAVRLAPAFEKQVSPELKVAAMRAEQTVKRRNIRLSDMGIETGALVQGRPTYGWDIRTGP